MYLEKHHWHVACAMTKYSILKQSPIKYSNLSYPGTFGSAISLTVYLKKGLGMCSICCRAWENREEPSVHMLETAMSTLLSGFSFSVQKVQELSFPSWGRWTVHRSSRVWEMQGLGSHIGVLTGEKVRACSSYRPACFKCLVQAGT